MIIIMSACFSILFLLSLGNFIIYYLAIKKEILSHMRSDLILAFTFLVLFLSCKKEPQEEYPEADKTIPITNNIQVDNGVIVRDPLFNLNEYDDFLKYLSTSEHILLVKMKDFKSTTSTDKVVLALRYDIDDNINAAVKFAYREHKYGIKSTYFVLHTAGYYSTYIDSTFKRNNNIIYFIKKIQNYFGHEIGFHNDLVTLQVVYNISSREYLKQELSYLRSNGINIYGTAYHGSPFCYKYNYSNANFWLDFPNVGWSYEFVKKDNKIIQIDKDWLASYSLEYESGLLKYDYFFSDANFVNNKRWQMKMVNLDTIKPGKKVIIMLHPQHWD
jgi:hypothetical protein